MSTTLDPTTTGAGPGADGAPPGRGWILAGLGAGVLAIVGGIAGATVDAVYDPDVSGDAGAILRRLSEQVPQILVFHTATMLSCALLVLFAVGLHHQLRTRTAPDSLVPGVAAAGLGLVAVAQLLGAGLTTEFAFALAEDPDLVLPESAALFNHWIGTIPWLWGGAGLAGLALFRAARDGAYAPWIGWASLVLGGLSALFLVSPLQYMAGMTGPAWLVVVSLGLLRTPRGS
ncbi:hypothetical protein GCM10011376_39360 [Nocardioides flavus (ex Wang et al. 2016)]|uniref:DUF4386 family protein n=1 Tax=Nocardioides flavus (ex Wang et al. 2016) TaxID=2058780 RepID=A0ABQ3HPW3_9ACTN|nr:hypothetical protein [Nocardioides flavus (ex Wang et al. 2016)]GHE19326.1 hypothetical protein GCM10011376_39360 [Nocardioides flavus (ex Wang et al. 2016)]